MRCSFHPSPANKCNVFGTDSKNLKQHTLNGKETGKTFHAPFTRRLGLDAAKPVFYKKDETRDMNQKPTKNPANKPANRFQAKKEIKKATAKPFFLDPYMGKYGLWIVLGLVSLLILIIFHKFIAGSAYYLFKDIGSDSINISLPQVTLLAKYLKTEGFPFWSFAQGMGQNIMPSLADPFSWILLLFGAENIAKGFIWMELAKMVLTATFFYCFLKELKLSSVSKILGTMLYTFSGFVIIGGGWGIFSAEACLFALLLLGFEKLYTNNSWQLLPVPVALILMVQPFDLYLYGLFLIFYFLLRHFSSDDSSLSKLFAVSLKMAGLVCLGVLISSFFLIGTVQMLLDSPRVGGNSSYTNKLLAYPVFGTEGGIHNLTAIMRFFSNDILGNGSGFKGWYNYLEAPMVYIGLLPLLLFPQVFIFLDKKKKIIFGIFLAIFLIPMVFPFFRYAFWLFTGDYYRGFSLFVSSTFLLFSLFVINELDKVKKVNILLLASTLLVLIVLLFYPYPNIDQLIEKDIRSLTLIFLFVYTGLILFLGYSKKRDAAKIILICVVFVEIACMNYMTINDRVVLTRKEAHQKTGFNDFSVEASAFVKSIDKGFFRVNKEYSSGPAIHSSLNDAKVQDYFGTSNYSSFNQKYYIRFQEEIGVIQKGTEFQSRWSPGLTTRPLLQFLGSVKYVFTKQANSQFLQLGYDSIAQTGDVKILRNKYFMPLGFTYDKYIPLGEFRKLSELQKQFVLLKAFVAEDPILPELKKFQAFNIQDTSKNYSWGELSADINARKTDTLRVAGFSNNRISGTIELQQTKLLFFSIPYDRGWHCKVDGKPAEPILSNIGFIGLCLQPGKHNVELSYTPPYFTLGLLASLAGLLIFFIFAGIKYFSDKKRALPNG